LAELHELDPDFAFGLLTLALAVLAHGLARPPDAARALASRRCSDEDDAASEPTVWAPRGAEGPSGGGCTVDVGTRASARNGGAARRAMPTTAAPSATCRDAWGG